TTTTPPQPPSRLSSSLPQDINTATRPLHTSLNHLITARLPLALPPHASDSKAYATGLRAFAHVYFAFEARWQALIAAESVREGSWIAVETYGEVEQGKGEAEVEAEAEAERECQRVRVNQVLADLLPPGLMRSRRLEADLAHLGIDSTEDLPTRVREFVARIDEEVEMKPWVLVAYAWVMYMAIFSGGRWVRQQLMDAGPGFWCHADGEAEDEQEWKGLAFLNFEGDEDGEDIKSEFKRRLASAEEVFDEEQRGDIVEEAKAIFTRCIGLVGELDDML
ncbi:heme oxygenase-like protein, partial [Viridothelium virens]